MRKLKLGKLDSTCQTGQSNSTSVFKKNLKNEICYTSKINQIYMEETLLYCDLSVYNKSQIVNNHNCLTGQLLL